jgi:hypothetical protein
MRTLAPLVVLLFVCGCEEVVAEPIPDAQADVIIPEGGATPEVGGSDVSLEPPDTNVVPPIGGGGDAF